MKFSDYLKSKLWEMAFSQEHALDKVEELAPKTIEHILKCRLMPDSREIPHWLNEIKAYTEKMDDYCDVKTRTGRPSYANLLNKLEVKLKYEKVAKKIPNIELEYSKKFKPSEVRKAIEFTISQMQEILKELSQDTFIWANMMPRITR